MSNDGLSQPRTGSAFSASGSRWGASPSHGVVLISTLLVSLAISFNGLDNAYGNPLLCLIAAGWLSLLFIGWPPAASFWRQTVPVIVLLCAAGLWAALPTFYLRLTGQPGPTLRPDLLLPELLGLFGCIAALLCGAIVGVREKGLGWAIDGLIVFGCANALFGLYLRASYPDLPFHFWFVREDGRFTGTVSNANVAGAYFGAMAVLCLSRLIRVPFKKEWDSAQAQMLIGRAALYFIALALLLGCCAMTGSRSAAIAMGMAALALTVPPIMQKRRNPVKTGMAAIALLLTLIIAALGISDLLFDRMSALQVAGAGRTLMFSHYSGLALEHPLFGYGLGSFPTLNEQNLTGPRVAQALWMVNSAHNLVLQLLIEGGIPYLVLVASAAFLIARGAVRRAKSMEWDNGSDGIIAALAGLLGCAMVDIALDVPGMTALLLFMAGLLWSPASRRRRSASRTSAA